jgi:hypothetical protein
MKIITDIQNLGRVRGLWTADAYGPLKVSDPSKFRTLMGLPPANSGIGPAIVPVTFARRILPKLPDLVRKEVERLLSGGAHKWHEAWENIVVNQGLNDLLDVTLSGATQDTTWFVGLTSATPTVAAGDTLASHAGWTEVTAYDETNRVAWVDAGASSQSITNSASPAAFTINANGTDVGGAFLAGVNTGTGGRLYAAGAFTAGNKSLDDNDVLSVTATFTAAAA